MTKKCVELYTELKWYGLVFSFFSSKEARIDFVQQFLRFVEEADLDVLEDVNRLAYVSLRGKLQDGQEKDTGWIKRIEKLSRWTFLDQLCYVVWFPWGIRQNYRVDTVDGEHYLVQFRYQNCKSLKLVETILYEDSRDQLEFDEKLV